MEKRHGKWFKGDFYSFSSAKMREARKYEKGVKKPTAVETKTRGGKTYSRFYHKPLRPGENWD